MYKELIERLLTRAKIRREIPTRKSVQEGKPDRISDLLEEAAKALQEVDTVVYPTEEMVRAGIEYSSQAISALMSKNMGSIGADKEYRELQRSTFKNTDLIDQYINEEIPAVTGIYLAMQRAKI